MPKLVGSSQTVVEVDGFKTDELAGNVATSDDTISIAYVTISEPTAEPWLTLDYDEWLCVRKGKMVLKFQNDDGSDASMEVKAGETCFVGKGERFQPVFPIVPTEYVPVCLPAFRPDRCHREEGEIASDVTNKLLKLHGMEEKGVNQDIVVDMKGTHVTNSCSPKDNITKDVLFHMCEKHRWEESITSQKAYYPPTFEVDGFFTHATAVPERLIHTANHFYKQSDAEWICLQLSRSALTNIGIITKDEGGLPVGDTLVSDEISGNKWVCPHIYGGIPTLDSLGVLTKTFPIARNKNGEFLNIVGLTD